MREKIIIFLIRKKMKVKKYQGFRFLTTKDNEYYFFGDDCLVKITPSYIRYSHCSLNRFLVENTKIIKTKSSFKHIRRNKNYYKELKQNG